MVDELRAQAILLEQAGISAVWLAEHHFFHDGWYVTAPNPILLGADIAGQPLFQKFGRKANVEDIDVERFGKLGSGRLASVGVFDDEINPHERKVRRTTTRARRRSEHPPTNG